MWSNVDINSNLIQKETEKAFLIKLPKTDWMFWVSKKCVRLHGKDGYLANVGIRVGAETEIFRTGKNFQKLDSKMVLDDELLTRLGGENE